VRAICNLPLGATFARSPAAMANLLGDCWGGEESLRLESLSSSADCHLHLYGKASPRAGRKMGHITALADSVEDAKQLVVSARACLSSAAA
jgi:5-(carboxyamino)imidazole ribonucleotide synthase